MENFRGEAAPIVGADLSDSQEGFHNETAYLLGVTGMSYFSFPVMGGGEDREMRGTEIRLTGPINPDG